MPALHPYSLAIPALLLLTCILTQSCTSAGKPAGVALDSLQGDWVLAELFGGPLSPLAEGAPSPGLTVSPEGKLSGFAGVNRFHGTLEVKGLAQGHFRTSPLAVTRMAGPPEAMELEQRYLQALGAAESCQLQGDALLLTGAGATLAQLVRAR